MARRSAKQKAATRKLVASNRRRRTTRRKAPKRRRRSSPKRSTRRRRTRAKKTNKRKRSSPSMVRKIPIIGSPIVKKAAAGIGIATIGVTILSLVAPQIAANPIVRPALAFLGGGIPGVVASIFLQGGAQLGNLFGGGQGGGGGGGAA